MTRIPLLCIAPLALVVLLSGSIPARAQSILVTTGEHQGFTRLVLQSAGAIDWRLGGADGIRHLDLDIGARPIDLSRAFARIGRTRLAALRGRADGLELELACDCRIEAWSERPNLIVLDIHDRGHEPTAEAVAPAPWQGPVLDPAAWHLSRTAGETIARAWQDRDARRLGSASNDDDSPGASALDRHEILRDLATQVAGALGQGVLSPASVPGTGPVGQLPAEPGRLSAATPNLRIATVDQRPDFSSITLPSEHPNSCAGAQALDFIITETPGAFNEDYSRLMRDWVGEFDVAGTASSLALVRLYLTHGFGAEARALLDRLASPLEGHDLLLGMSDLLEQRPSNARHRLSSVVSCGGAPAMMAALAGAPAPEVRANEGEIALAFSLSPASLRAAIGTRLTEILLDADALEAARLVLETLKRSTPVDGQDLAVLEARLEHGRGEAERAADRLAHLPGQDAAGLLTRLELSLERGTAESVEILDHAEALASTLRDTEHGTQLMSASIRQRIAGGTAQEALEPLDRLDHWAGTGPSARAHVTGLRDAVWRGIAEQADDAALIALAMARDDWRAPGLSAPTRTQMAGRLLRFGLADLVAPLLEPAETPELRRHLARLRLVQGDPHGALEALEADSSEAAQQIRADALLQRQASGRAVELPGAIGTAGAAVTLPEAFNTWDAPAPLAAVPDPPPIATPAGGTTLSPRLAAEDSGAGLTQAALTATTEASDGDLVVSRPRAPDGDGRTVNAGSAAGATGADGAFIDTGLARDASPAEAGAPRSPDESLTGNERQRGAELLAESAQLRESLAQLIATGASEPER